MEKSHLINFGGRSTGWGAMYRNTKSKEGTFKRRAWKWRGPRKPGTGGRPGSCPQRCSGRRGGARRPPGLSPGPPPARWRRRCPPPRRLLSPPGRLQLCPRYLRSPAARKISENRSQSNSCELKAPPCRSDHASFLERRIAQFQSAFRIDFPWNWAGQLSSEILQINFT